MIKIENEKIVRQKATFKISISSTKKGFNLEISRYTKLPLFQDGLTPETRKKLLSLEAFIGENGDYSLANISEIIEKNLLELLKNEVILSKKNIVNILSD